ncbi:MAG: hypothetical protein EP329_24105 [Deltaproteobacteria bacterium]|nr:MAG: hypothetical protein EP329_24105 [Deltaproteobacteria bacterium]
MRISKLIAPALFLLAASFSHGALAQPALDLPPDPPPAPPTRVLGLSNVTLGGYGELHFNHLIPAEGDSSSEIDLHRLVLFVGYTFTDAIRFMSEIEVEHAHARADKAGEVAIEQAYIDWDLAGAALTLRAGVVLVPMGIINETHEPPTFHGVERPNVEKNIIPSTWREGGIGLVGRIGDSFRYQAYLLGGLDASGFSTSSGIRGGRQTVSEARADGLAFAGSVAYQPVVGLNLGLSGYLGNSGANADPYFDDAGAALDLSVLTAGVAAHAQYKGYGVEAKALFASFFISDTEALRTAKDADGEDAGKDVPAQTMGGYVEVAYNVLQSVESTQLQLLPFVRAEFYDTAASIEGRERTNADDNRAVTELVVGLSLRPAPQLVFKADAIFRSFGGDRDGETVIDLGVGFNF